MMHIVKTFCLGFVTVLLVLAALFAICWSPPAKAATLPVVPCQNGYCEALPTVQLAPGTQITAASGDVAASAAVATLAAVSTKTTFISGLQCTVGGATGAALVNVTVAGVITGTMTYTVGTPAGATLIGTPLVVAFNPPVPASAVNTAIVVTMPSLGTGNLHAACNAQGFQF